MGRNQWALPILEYSIFGRCLMKSNCYSLIYSVSQKTLLKEKLITSLRSIVFWDTWYILLFLVNTLSCYVCLNWHLCDINYFCKFIKSLLPGIPHNGYKKKILEILEHLELWQCWGLQLRMLYYQWLVVAIHLVILFLMWKFSLKMDGVYSQHYRWIYLCLCQIHLAKVVFITQM